MRYVGSKRLVAKYILPIMLYERGEQQCYVEPFIGGGNIFGLVPGPKIGSDVNPNVMSALNLIKNDVGCLPKHYHEVFSGQWEELKANPAHPLHGYVGYACSWGGVFYGGKIKKIYPSEKKPCDRVAAQYKAAVKLSEGLQNADLYNLSYQDLTPLIPKNSIIYCDPPYAGTKGYGQDFNHEEFWEWVRRMSLEGHKVYVSEYTAPDDFVSLWQKRHTKTISVKCQGSVEKLFIYKGIL